MPCFVYGCDTGYKAKIDDKIRLFKIPRNCSDVVRDKWINTIRGTRSDTKYNPQNNNHRICYKHFQDKYIVKFDIHNTLHGIVKLERDNWTLTADAVPTIFTTCAKNPVKESPKKRKPPKNRNQFAKRQKISYQPLKPQSNEVKTVADADSDFSNAAVTSLGHKYISVAELQTSESFGFEEIKRKWITRESKFDHWEIKWVENNGGQKCYFWVMEYGDTVSIKKHVQIDLDLTARAYISGLEVTEDQVPRSVPSFTAMIDILTKMDLLNLCEGIRGYSQVKSMKNSTKYNGRWFSNSCAKIGNHVVCISCKKVSTALGHVLYKKSTKPVSPVQKILHTNRYYRKRITKLTVKQRAIRMELMNLTQSINKMDMKSLHRILQKLKLAPGTRLAISESIRKAKAQNKQGIRYSPEWLIESTLLKIKSAGAYKYLRESKILALPHPITIRQLISGSPYEFGFNQFSLDAIQRQFKGKIQRDRQGVVVFDEIKLRKTLDFNKGTLKFDGYVNYGDFTEISSSGPELADHALVFAYRPYNDKWMQPVGVFATKGAAKGHMLGKLLVECVMRLEAVGAEVLATVSDGATTNKNLWTIMNISGVKGKVVNKCTHPCDDNRFLYFMSDIPHVIKCIRNHFHKHQNLLFGGQEINYNFYSQLYLKDNANCIGLKKCPKLTKAHINPNSFEKMRVNYATQLFSRSVETGMSFYRGIGQLPGSESTEAFTSKMNQLFDLMNSRLPEEGLKANSRDVRTLQSFYDFLNSEKTNTFASPQTLQSLRVSIISTIEVSDNLSNNLGFSYVLTSKLNQDCLERFFGLISGAGGREQHPTVSNFVQLYRLLSIYNAMKTVVRGNITSDERSTVLANFSDSLRTEAKSAKKIRSDIRKRWESALLNKVIFTRSMMEFRESSGSTKDNNLVYYVTGFVVKKARKLLECKDCISTLHAGSTLPDEAYLTGIMESANGCRRLVYPSRPFFNLILTCVEPVVASVLANGALFGDALLTVIQRTSLLDPGLLGCDVHDHAEIILSKLIPYYIMLRFNFYSTPLKQGMAKLASMKRKISNMQDSYIVHSKL